MEGKIAKELGVNWSDARKLVARARLEEGTEAGAAQVEAKVRDIWESLPVEERQAMRHNRGSYQKQQKQLEETKVRAKKVQKQREKEQRKKDLSWSGGGDPDHPLKLTTSNWTLLAKLIKRK